MSTPYEKRRKRVCGDCEACFDRMSGEKVTGHYCVVSGVVVSFSQACCHLSHRQVLDALNCDALKRGVHMAPP